MKNREKQKIDVFNREFIFDIKGTKYKLSFFNDSRSYLGRTNIDDKTIIIYSQQTKRMILDTIYHELLHALFYECGLTSYYGDETLINWLDAQRDFLIFMCNFFDRNIEAEYEKRL